MGCLPEDLKLLIREASVIEIVPDNARRPAFSLTEYVCLYQSDASPHLSTRHSGQRDHTKSRKTQWTGRKRKTTSKFKEIQKRTMDRWQSSKSSTGPPTFQLGQLGYILGDFDAPASLSFDKALGSVCPKSPRLPMRRTSDDSKEAANGRGEKPLKPPVRRTSMDVDLKSAERFSRRSTGTAVERGEPRVSYRDGDLSSVIGKLLHELEDLELVSSDEDDDDDAYTQDSKESLYDAPGVCALPTAERWS